MAQTLSEWASGRICDWCQEACDHESSDLNVLTCSFRGCPTEDSDDNNSVYHKECVEAYLKSSTERGTAKQRKIGFRCPRGCTKLTEDAPCPGVVNKSHPIVKGKAKKKKKETALLNEPVKKFGPEAKAARAEAKATELLEEERRKTAAMEKRAKEAEARNKQLEKRLIAEGRNASGAERGSRSFADNEATGRNFGASSSETREDYDCDYDCDRNWEPRGASLWDHVDAAARTKKKKNTVSLESADETNKESRRPAVPSRASLDTPAERVARWAPQTPGFGPGAPPRVILPPANFSASLPPAAPLASSSLTAFPSLGSSAGGSPAGPSPILSGHGSPSGPGFAFGTGPTSAAGPSGPSSVPAANPALAIQAWMQRCRAGCPPGHEARPLLDDLIKKRVKSLVDSVGGVASRVDWANQDTSFAEQCVRRAEQESETLRLLERAREASRDASGDATRETFLFDIDPSTISTDTVLGGTVEKHIRRLLLSAYDWKRRNVNRFLAGACGEDDDAHMDDTAASRLCAASVLRRAPEAAVNVLRSNGFEEWACRLHVLFWGSPFTDGGETFDDFERMDFIESRYGSDEAKRWLMNDAYARMGFTPHDADQFELEGIPRRATGIDFEARALKDAYLLGLPRGMLDHMVARNQGDVFRGVADALERAGAG